MAIRRHRLPRFWLLVTLGLVAGAVGAAYWWERQLPGRLERAAQQGRLDDCLRYGEQLASLRWLGGAAPQEQGRCRRLKAQNLWKAGQVGDALRVQLQLVNSEAGNSADQRRLVEWQRQLEARALARFQGGDLEGALAVLATFNADHNPEGTALGDNLRENWNRNRLQRDRTQQLIPQKRWWEALDALNRIDHPWWKAHTQPLRQQVQQGIDGLKSAGEKQHDGHGKGGLESNVPSDKLNALVTAKIAAGQDDWQAFTSACKELGGKVVEAGPESACRR
ncbi:hypothetical protein [Vulcanococcus limneticus]|uniref:hypothetical protein n=1 Tax=Vulcanococcus limneticus TaxID=2170428 RepID=UPI00398BC228